MHLKVETHKYFINDCFSIFIVLITDLIKSDFDFAKISFLSVCSCFEISSVGTFYKTTEYVKNNIE